MHCMMFDETLMIENLGNEIHLKICLLGLTEIVSTTYFSSMHWFDDRPSHVIFCEFTFAKQGSFLVGNHR